jgi:DNA replication and repair protein RecF
VLINGHIAAGDGNRTVTYRVNGAKRTVAVNGNIAADARRFFGQFLALDFTPRDLDLVAGPPAGRRKYLDRLAVMLDRSFVAVLMQYQRALKNRNAVLVSHAKARTRADNENLLRELHAWNVPLIECGHQIAGRRAMVSSELAKYCDVFYRYVTQAGNESAEKVSLSYQSKFIENNEVVEIDQLVSALNSSIEKDLRYQSTTFGVHQDDVDLVLDTGFGPKSARSTASQGQLKSLALALKLAGKDVVFGLTKEHPVLLLDDVESELDPVRRDALFELVSSVENQVIITATDVSSSAKGYFGELDVRRLEKGLLTKP